MNMAKKILFVASEWVTCNLRKSENWKDPVTGIRGSAFYIANNGLSKTFDTGENGNVGVIISKPKPGEQEPPTLMVQIPNGLAIFDTLPDVMMMHKDKLLLMEVSTYEKQLAKVSTALTEGVSATA